MAAYAIFLATGHTIQSKSIKASTIEKYLYDAKGFIQKFDSTNRDARKDEHTGKMAEPIQKVLDEQKRFEKVPNRREGYTIAMHKLLFQKTQLLSDDCSDSANRDWMGLGLNHGFRQVEFCQSSGSGILTRVYFNPLGECYAFTLDDVKPYGKGKVQLDLIAAMNNPLSVEYYHVTFRWQKNKEHGIFRWVARNDKLPYLCPVRMWTRILKRFLRLRGVKYRDQPLAVYRNKSGQVRNITADTVTALMRALAVEHYNLTDKEDIQKFSCHSLRVGACCLLFACGYPAEFIQRVLRWKSDAWKTYVRDLIVTALKQNEAMLDADTMPEL